MRGVPFALLPLVWTVVNEGLNVVAGFNIVDGISIKVSEAALSATATGGGSITCSAHHP